MLTKACHSQAVLREETPQPVPAIFQAVNKFCRNLLQEVEFENAVRGRVDVEVLAGKAIPPRAGVGHIDNGAAPGGVGAAAMR